MDQNPLGPLTTAFISSNAKHKTSVAVVHGPWRPVAAALMSLHATRVVAAAALGVACIVAAKMLRHRGRRGRMQKGISAVHERLVKRVEGIRHAVVTERQLFAASLHSLARANMSISKYNKAKLMMEMSLTIRRELLGTEHPDYLVVMQDLRELCSTMSLKSDFADFSSMQREA